MIIGVPKEIKPQEYRVGLTPANVAELVGLGHSVLVEHDAGVHVGFSDEAYVASGARIAVDPAEAYSAELVVKVKEPQAPEIPLLRDGQILFSYLHLAPEPALTQGLLERGVVGIAYETVEDRNGHRPLLIPMSELAGRIATQAGATALQMEYGGRGVLLGGVPGVPPANVVVVGGGIVGLQAARVAMGMGAEITILDISHDRLRYLDEVYGPRLKTVYSGAGALREYIVGADLVVAAALRSGYRSPVLIDAGMVRDMKPGSVIVDVAIDQGGCVETSRPTTHHAPTFIEHEVVHYCVANMPSACARTATMALTNATLPYVRLLADLGYQHALSADSGFAMGLNVYRGHITNEGVAESLGQGWKRPEEIF
ncbi:MAG: alanine dehydrogenase [Gammaproteobacteria bacterium]|nr:alanine dehydrogenase [Gammaproteobacteria bacterium]